MVEHSTSAERWFASRPPGASSTGVQTRNGTSFLEHASMSISEPGSDHAQSAMEFDTPPRTSMAARVLVPENISVQRDASVVPSTKSLAPVNTSALSTDPWGMPSRQSFNVQRCASVAPPAKSLTPVNTSALSTDPRGTPTRQSFNVQLGALVALSTKSLTPVNTSALSTDPWVTPIRQSVNVQFSPAFPEGTPIGQSVISAHDAMLAPPVKSPSPVQTSAVSIDPWDSPIKQCVKGQSVPVFQWDMSSRQHLDPWGTPPTLRAQIARTTYQEDMSSQQHVICAPDP